MVVNTGGVLAGASNGTTGGRVGSVTLSGGSIHPGPDAADGSVGTLTASTLTVNSGSDLRFDITTGPAGGNDRLQVTNKALFAGPSTVTPVIDDITALAPGQYTLLTAGSITINSGATPVLAGLPTTSRLNFSLAINNTPGLIALNVTGATPKGIRWSGSSGTNLWDVNTTLNWLDSVNSNEHYFDYDSPTFDDAAFNSNIVLNSVITPHSLTFANNSLNYSVTSSSGTGGITGTTSLVKTGSEALTLGLSNTYTGQTLIAGGTLVLATSTALSPATTLVLGVSGSAGKLDLAGNDGTVAGLGSGGGPGTGNTITNSSPAASTLTFAGNGPSTFPGTIQDGAGGVSLHIASGTLVLTGNNTNSGTTTIDDAETSDQDTPGTVKDGVATLRVGNGGTTGSVGPGAIVDNGVLVLDRSDSVNVANNISGSGSVIKTGNGTLTLSGTNTFHGISVLGGGAHLRR